ncbi:MAG: PHP domain-containing protein [Candidatus Saccharicenans sp.]
MENGCIDLHLHSHFSCDGDFSPEELIIMAKASGFRAIAIADHDTVSAYPEALEIGRSHGVEVIPSIEVTTLYDGREFHLQLPFVDWESRAIRHIIQKMEHSRMEEAQARVARLRELGINIDWNEVWRECQGVPPLGVKIAQVLLSKPESREHPLLEKYYDENNQPVAPYLFYQDYFAEDGLAYVSKKHLSLEEVLSLAPETGGVPVLSHPGAYFQRTTREDLARLKELGLQGLEVFTSYHTPEQTSYYLTLCQEFDLVATAGSDFHGKIKPRVKFGQIRDGHYDMVLRLKERMSR